MPQRNVYYIIVVALISLFLASRTTFKEQLVREIVQLVRRSSLYSPSQNDVIEGALDGVAASVNDEPYTDYLPPLKQTEYLRDMHGQYAGVGLSNFVKDQESGEFYFVPFRNTPAARASLKFGDRIVAVDGAKASDKSIFELIGMLRGEENETVEVTIRPHAYLNHLLSSPNNEEETVVKTLKREVLKQDLVLGDSFKRDGSWNFVLNEYPEIGYIEIRQFADDVGTLVVNAISELGQAGIEKLILDFRGNTGGSLGNAIEICNALLAKDSPIVETRDARGKTTKFVSVTQPQKRYKVAVLIDGDSASASEIVAAALQDAGAAKIVGERSFGKGTVQSILELPCNLGTLHLTTSSFWRPSGRPIHRKHGAKPEDDWGVLPDDGYEIVISPVQRFYQSWLRNARLSGKPNNPLNDAALELITKSTQNLSRLLLEGAPEEKAEAALELGLDSSEFSLISGEYDQASAPGKTENAAEENTQEHVEIQKLLLTPFVPQGRAPYFDPQLDRAIDYLRNEANASE